MTPDLQRFIDAQQPVYAQVCAELRDGVKRSHWMWFIFPQLAGLGHSPTAQYFAIANKVHAAAYWKHPVLGERLRECTGLVNSHTGLSAAQMFGYPDYLKLHSSLTLFHDVAPQEQIFTQALRQLYGGELDEATVRLLQDSSGLAT
jgi:uncharacterized protein (DUF1810 family)